MALPGLNRGWVLSSDADLFADEAATIAFTSETLSDASIMHMKTNFVSLVSLSFVNCTFGPATDFSDMPVLENAATITTIVASGATGLSPGDNGGVPASWAAATKVASIDVSGNGWTAAEVDAFLIGLNATVIAGMSSAAAACTLDISGNTARTAASDAAVTALQADSPAWTITTD